MDKMEVLTELLVELLPAIKFLLYALGAMAISQILNDWF